MRHVALVATVLTFVPAAAGAAPTPTPYGLAPCRQSSVADPGDAGRQIGVLLGGPVAAAELPLRGSGVLANPVSVTLTCTVVVDGVEAVAVSATGTAVAALAPAPVSFPTGSWVEVCTEVAVTTAGGATYHYYGNSQNGMFERTPGTCSGASCESVDRSCNFFIALLEDYVFAVLDRPIR